MPKRSTTPEADAAQPHGEHDASAGKGHATPSRKAQEAARKRPLVPSDRKEAARLSRQQNTTARERARAGMAAGDDRYLTQRDRGPQRRFVRDYVDARFNIGEFMIPVMLVVIILTFVPVRDMQVYGIIVLWAFFIVALVDCFWLAHAVHKRVVDKFGVERVERGLRWYAGMRALQLRMIRLPKPQVKRGRYPS